MWLGLLAVVWLPAVLALYDDPGSSVKVLDKSMFRRIIKDEKTFALVEFFADWCEHCKNFAPTYELVAHSLKGIVPVFAVKDEAVLSDEGVKMLPTVKLYSGGSAIAFEGVTRDVQPIVEFVFENAKKIVSKRVSRGIKEEKDPTTTPKKNKEKKKQTFPAEAVVELTTSNFKELVMDDRDHAWFVMFYAPWCGHCQKLHPTWKQLAKSVSAETTRIGKVDATTEQYLAREYGVAGYPTLILFPMNKQKPLTYSGGRDLRSLEDYVREHSGVVVRVSQIISHEQYLDNCKSSLCSIAFLPNKLDVSESEWNGYFQIYKSSAETANTPTPMKYFWTEAGYSTEMEEKLLLQFGWPAVVVTDLAKDRFFTLKGLFSSSSLQKFYRQASLARPPFSSLSGTLPEFKSKKKTSKKEEL